jgi:hypothetical protein
VDAPGKRNADVILLGSGRSVLDLGPGQLAHLRGARCVLALNKYLAVHDLLGVVPTHVLFLDLHPPAPEVLVALFRVCARDGLRDVTFVLNERYRDLLPGAPGAGRRPRAAPRGGPAGPRAWLSRARSAARWVAALRRRRALRPPPGCPLEFVALTDWLDEHSAWARSLAEPLFHYRISLGTALNYLALRHPGSHVRLVGVDFNSPGYFFQEEMERRGHRWDDWTTARAGAGHFALVEHAGGTFFDRLPYVLARLSEHGVRLTCASPTSEMVLRGGVAYEPVPGALPPAA